MPRKKTHREFLAQVSSLPIEVLGVYKGGRQKLDIRCTSCGHEWAMRVDHILSGKGCPKCSRSPSRKRTEDIKKELLCREIRLDSEYTKRSDPVSVTCMKCGYSWTFSFASSRGSCLRCASRKVGENRRVPPEKIYDDGCLIKFDIGKGIVVEMSKCDEHLIDRACSLDGKGYVKIRIGGKTHSLQRLIMNNSSLLVDHKDRNPLNNHRSNLRYVTKSQNAMNSKVRSDSISGVRGVSYNKKRDKYTVSICKDGVVNYLGTFNCLDDAKKAREKAELELFGEFSPLNRVGLKQ